MTRTDKMIAELVASAAAKRPDLTPTEHEILRTMALQALQSMGIEDPDSAHLIVRNVYAEGLTIYYALHGTAEERDAAWLEIYGIVMQALKRSRFTSYSDILFNEFSPDTRSLELLMRNLGRFQFACHLRTFIYKIANNALNEWIRSHAARKRGGYGIIHTRTQRDTQQYYSSRTVYMSQVLRSPDTGDVEALACPSADPSHLVTNRLLLEHIGKTISQLKVTRAHPILLRTWPALLLEQVKIAKLAELHGVSTRTMFALKRRLIAELKPYVTDWLTPSS